MNTKKKHEFQEIVSQEIFDQNLLEGRDNIKASVKETRFLRNLITKNRETIEALEKKVDSLERRIGRLEKAADYSEIYEYIKFRQQEDEYQDWLSD